MVLKASKMGVLGPQLQKIVVDVDDNTLGAIEHTGLLVAVSTMLPANSTLIRRTGLFLITSIAYNLVISRAQSSESGGMGR